MWSLTVIQTEIRSEITYLSVSVDVFIVCLQLYYIIVAYVSDNKRILMLS